MNDGKKSGRRPRFYEGNSPASLHISAWARSVRLGSREPAAHGGGVHPELQGDRRDVAPPEKIERDDLPLLGRQVAHGAAQEPRVPCARGRVVGALRRGDPLEILEGKGTFTYVKHAPRPPQS